MSTEEPVETQSVDEDTDLPLPATEDSDIPLPPPEVRTHLPIIIFYLLITTQFTLSLFHS